MTIDETKDINHIIDALTEIIDEFITDIRTKNNNENYLEVSQS